MVGTQYAAATSDGIFTRHAPNAHRSVTGPARTLRGVQSLPEGPMATLLLLLSAAIAVYLIAAVWWPEKF